MSFYFFLALQRGERATRLVLILAVSGLVAFVGESMGFFVLLPLWAFTAVVKSGRSMRSIATIALALVVLGGVLVRAQPEFVDGLVSRVITVVQP